MHFVAFLRAINVTNRYVKMADLRQILSGLDGLTSIETYIQSGNVLFEAEPDERGALEGALEAHLHAQLGFPVPTFVRSAAEIAAIAAHWPFHPEDAAALAADVRVYVAFIRAAPLPAQRAMLEARSDAVDVLRVFGRQVFWLYRRGSGKSTVSAATIEDVLQGETTVRNISTIRKLAALLAAGA